MKKNSTHNMGMNLMVNKMEAALSDGLESVARYIGSDIEPN